MIAFLNQLFRMRNRHFLVLDILLLTVLPILALMLRVDSIHTWISYSRALLVYTILAVSLRLIIFYGLGIYSRFWRYASIDELSLIVIANFAATGLLLTIFFVANVIFASDSQYLLPRSLPFIDGLLTLAVIGGTRFSIRILDRWSRRRRRGRDARRVLVIGAGDAGSMIVREMQSARYLDLNPVGFVDDDINKLGSYIYGVPILGARPEIPKIVREHRIQEIVIAMPSVSGKVVREFLQACERLNVRTKIIPGIPEILDGTVSVSQIRDVEIEDLLRREPIRLDNQPVIDLIQGQRVLITGGGGSIGSELCRQVLRCEPAELTIVGHGENSVFAIQNELRRLIQAGNLRTSLNTHIADIRFAERIDHIVGAHQPEIIFHAAAHKHVPLMESNPSEAITNNVVGTRNLLRAAAKHDVGRFVMISTDKAVNHTSMMGASKRTAELLVHQTALKTGRSYVAVRFGNVLGSRGSVVLTFKEQIAEGGPVTVTHPDMERFFMTIPEAVQLVLQAAVLGDGGEVFLLDMGDPVKIVDLARDLIELSGLEVNYDIDIVFSGARPGEKLYEELFVPGEDYQRTQVEKIFIAANANRFVPDDLDTIVGQLQGAAENNDLPAIYRHLQQLIPEYRPRQQPITLKATERPPAPTSQPISVPSLPLVPKSSPSAPAA